MQVQLITQTRHNQDRKCILAVKIEHDTRLKSNNSPSITLRAGDFIYQT